MIELPDFARIGSAVPTLVDSGFTQRGIGSRSRIDRKGSHYKIACAYGPYYPENSRIMVSRLIAAKREGLLIRLPMLHSQGAPGSPVVDGATATGRTLAIRGLTPGYFCKEGYWLSIENGDGQHFLHNVATGGMADASGELSIMLNEMVRDSFSDGATINLAKPMVEGLVDGNEVEWALSVDRVVPINFSIEEKK